MGIELKLTGGATQEKGVGIYPTLIMGSALSEFEPLVLNPWAGRFFGLVYFSLYHDVCIAG